MRHLSRFWQSPLTLLASALLVQVPAAFAQDGIRVPLPESVVLVLKLIDKTHVKPTTGVVFDASGLVLVPADFVTAGDEIVVLDGGTDIVRNGRPASTVARSRADGLAVLSVVGLQRRAANISPGDPGAEQGLVFTAFPPAELIAQGDQPLRVRYQGAASAVPLPNVSGPLFDGCGSLAGFNLAVGTPAVQGTDLPLTLNGAQVRAALAAFGYTPHLKACAGSVDQVAANTEDREHAEAADPAQSTAKAPAGAEPLMPGMPESGPDNQDTGFPEPAVAATTDRTVSETVTAPLTSGNHRARLATGAGLGLALVLLLWWFWRKSRTGGARVKVQIQHPGEPETGPLLNVSSGETTDTYLPGHERDAVCDGPPFEKDARINLQLSGTRADGLAFDSLFAVSPDSGMCLVTDMGGDAPQVPGDDFAGPQAGFSLQVSKGACRVCLSNPGTGPWPTVRGVPCLPGELLQVLPADPVQLGQFQFIIKRIIWPGDSGE